MSFLSASMNKIYFLKLGVILYFKFLATVYIGLLRHEQEKQPYLGRSMSTSATVARTSYAELSEGFF
jgi:hypothetical protein